MSIDKWFCNARPLDFGKGQGGGRDQKMEYLFAGALALIIILALGLTIKYSFFGGSQKGKMPDELHFFCTACNQEVVVKTKDMKPEDLTTNMVPMGMPGAQMSVCPKCNQAGLVMESKCPICEQYYVSDFRLNPAIALGGPRDEICKKCGGNITEYYRNKTKKAR